MTERGLSTPAVERIVRARSTRPPSRWPTGKAKKVPDTEARAQVVLRRLADALKGRTDARKPVKRRALLIFPNAEGRPVQRSPWVRTWSGIVKRANDLRHYYASLLIKHRESVKTVQKRLGHSKPSITLDTYTHLWMEDEDTTRAAVEAALGDVPPMCPGRQAG
jgi:integrase